jgi:hypothetical protein
MMAQEDFSAAAWKGEERGHCEEPQATKQSLFQAKIASLRSQ